MPNIFKAFLFGDAKDDGSKAKVEAYQFPKAEELVVEAESLEELPVFEEEPSQEGEEGFDVLVANPEPEPEEEQETDPLSFAQVQA